MLHALRLALAGTALARAGFFGFAQTDNMPPGPARAVRAARLLEPRLSEAERGRRLTAALTRLGPSYVKLGQFLATRPDIVGVGTAEVLSGLKDEMPPFSTEVARRIVAQNIGAPIESVFDSFSEPVAAASIAQVHRARLNRERGGREVAVKVLRPDARRRFARDLADFYAAARLIERAAPEARRLRPVAVVETLERSVVLEMDLRLEAAALSEMAENVREEADFRVPAAEWTLTGRDVLVTEWIDGIKLRDLAGLDAAGLDRRQLAAGLMQSFLRHALDHGFFHADMHEGNLFVDRDGRLVAIDFGIMGRIGKKERRFLAEILYGFIRRDYRRVAEVHIEAGYVPAIHAAEDFAQALRAIGEPIHGQRARDISMAKLLGLLFEVTDLFDMRTRPELILLQKTMVVVEGVARRLDPDFDMWATAEPVVGRWVERHLGPSGRLEEAGETLRAIGRAAGRLPDTLERAEVAIDRLAALGQGGLRLDDDTVQRLAKAATAQLYWTRWALRLGALALIVVSVAAVTRSL